jgi:2-polyprenyl-3-methyl-5-hydroxy-6-metoxy-1,4-benzoquinol methylase
MGRENYLQKDISYFTNPRIDLISLMPSNPYQRVLEIGMGGGDTLVYIKQRRLAGEAVGIDLMSLPGSNQQNPLIDKVYFLDLERENLPFSNEYFDVIIAGDILEHLINPWELLQNLNKILKVGGHMIISIPNIRDINAIYSILLKGTFGYTTQGIFDKTHLRFFCKKDMIDLIESVNKLRIEKIIPIQYFGNHYRRKLFNKLSFKIFEEFTTSQYVFKIVKTD